MEKASTLEPAATKSAEPRSDAIDVTGELTFLKGWGISLPDKGWTHVRGGPVGSLSRKTHSGRRVRIRGRWVQPSKSREGLPPGDQQADPRIWGYIQVESLEFLSSQEAERGK